MSLISNNIKYLRKLNGLTQEQFAKRIGIKRSLLGAYEEGRANPNWNALTAVAKAFNTTIDTLLKQDMQKIRSTPDLSIPLINNGPGHERPVQRASNIPTIPPPIFREPDEPFGADPPPEPRPLSAVLENFYPGHERPVKEVSFLDELTSGDRVQTPPRPPEIRSVAPNQVTPAAKRQTVLVKAVPHRLSPKPVPARLGSMAPTASAPTTRLAEPLPPFNNVYGSNATNPVRSLPADGTLPATERGPAMAYVMQFQFAEYSQQFQQPDYLSRLPVLRLPMLPAGHYRAFEADADFAFPGALLAGQHVRNWFDIADGRLYVLVTKMGVLCRRVFNQVKTKGILLLTTDRPTTPSSEVLLNDVLEVWEVRAFVSQQLPDGSMADRAALSRIRQLADELRAETERLR